jgi:uncharacterized protein (TIGR00369 family)
MSSEDHFRKLERMYKNDRTNAYYEPVLSVSEGEATLTMRAQERFFHAAGAVHGSIYFKALDDAAWFAVASLVEDVFIVTASFNIYLLRPVSSGELRAHGRLVHRTGRVFIAESRLTGDDGRELARGSGTFMRSKTPLTPNLGYG